MNVSLRKHFFLLVLLAVSVSAWGQRYYPVLETSQGQEVRDTINALSTPENLAPFIASPPSDGSVELRKISDTQYEVIYTPLPSFMGTDEFRIQFFEGCGFCLRFSDYTINVTAANIIANHDYAFANENSTVSINVLANDESSNGVLNLRTIPLTNHGTVSFEPGSNSISFTPEPDFEGIAYINYVVCNGAGLCDNGTATIQVLGDDTDYGDTLQIFTKKDIAQVVLVPEGFELTNDPANGIYDLSGDAPIYVPDQDFTGKDYLQFHNGSTAKVVEVVVIDAEDNLMAFDDEAYTVPGNSVEINAVGNDLYGADSGCFMLQSQPNSGTVEATEDGIVTYKPDAGFTGVDWFTYSVNAPGCGAKDEIATVYVFVSNFEPSATKFNMRTPKQTPLVIGNNVPIDNFQYEIEDQGDLGRAFILQGDRDTTINGQTISGENVILYVPNDNVTSGTDELEITYCVFDGAGECAYKKAIKVEINILDIDNTNAEPFCVVDCVWPGDTNMDGVVSIEDLLPIGLSMGEVGTPRSESEFEVWYGQRGNDWSEDMGGEVNLKHIDTDGDSVVTALDTSAIREFYGFTHGLTSVQLPFFKYDVQLQGDIFANPGDVVEFDIVLGSEAEPVADLYGFTFPFEYSPVLFKPDQVSVDFSDPSWLSYNSPSLYMSHNNRKGLVSSGFTRTSGISASGYGKIGKLRLVVVEDINGFRPDSEGIIVTLGGGTATAANGAGQNFAVNIESINLQIVPQSEEEIANTPLTEDLVKVWPNPAHDLLNVHLNAGQEFERVQIFNMTGQVIYDSGQTLARRTQLDVSRLKNGIYVLSVMTPKGVVNKKFEVVR